MLTCSVSSITLSEVTQLELPITHAHARTRSNTHHTSSPLYPSILHVRDGVRTAKEKLWSLFVSLSFSPPPTSLTLGGVETRPPHRARLFCLSNSKRAQPCLFFSLSLCIPPLLSALFIAQGMHF